MLSVGDFQTPADWKPHSCPLKDRCEMVPVLNAVVFVLICLFTAMMYFVELCSLSLMKV